MKVIPWFLLSTVGLTENAEHQPGILVFYLSTVSLGCSPSPHHHSKMAAKFLASQQPMLCLLILCLCIDSWYHPGDTQTIWWPLTSEGRQTGSELISLQGFHVSKPYLGHSPLCHDSKRESIADQKKAFITDSPAGKSGSRYRQGS